MITAIEFNNVGAINSETPISVDDTAAVSYTVTAGKKGVTFLNLTQEVWYGGSNVSPAGNIGVKLFVNQALTYKGVKNTFKIYFKCAAGKASTIGVVSHD